MKSYISLILILAAAALSLCACVEEANDSESSASFTDAFTSAFGKVGAAHDWNMAERTRATIVPAPGHTISKADVYINVCQKYYLTASYSNIDREITILTDTPKGIDYLYIYTDGTLYRVKPYGVIDFASQPQTADDPQFDPAAASPLGWILAAEVPTDNPDFDYNDFVAHLTYTHAPGFYILPGQEGDVKCSDSPALKVTASAAGISVPVWLHYFNGVTDIILTPKDQGYVFSPSSQREALASEALFTAAEWHQWFSHKGYMPSKPDKSTATSPVYDTSAFRNDPTCHINTHFDKSVSSGQSVDLIPDLLSDFSFTSYSQTILNGDIQTPLSGLYITVNTPVGANTSYGEKLKAGQVVGHTISTTGFAPMMLLIPDVSYDDGNWRWPTEGTSMLLPYPTFKTYVKGDSFVAEGDVNSNWYTLQHADPEVAFDRTFLYAR